MVSQASTPAVICGSTSFIKGKLGGLLILRGTSYSSRYWFIFTPSDLVDFPLVRCMSLVDSVENGYLNQIKVGTPVKSNADPATSFNTHVQRNRNRLFCLSSENRHLLSKVQFLHEILQEDHQAE